jgi:hypothetical protein
LRHWLADTDLSGLRDEKALSALPQEEREAWRRLWGDVRDLLSRAGNK